MKYKLFLTLVLILLKIGKLLSQPQSDSLILSFYQRHLNHDIGDTFVYRDQKIYGYVLVQTDLAKVDTILYLGHRISFHS